MEDPSMSGAEAVSSFLPVVIVVGLLLWAMKQSGDEESAPPDRRTR